jgi:hypothetical protein
MIRQERRRIKMATRKETKRQNQKALRAQREAEGLGHPVSATLPNGKSPFDSVEEEREERQDAVIEQQRVFQSLLPKLLRKLGKIPDPRNPLKIKHKLTMVVLLGILSFVYQMSSRREANRKMTRPVFVENLRQFLPELETIPHQDTLNRLLSNIEVEQIEATHIDMIRNLIRKKKFARYLIEDCYPIAFDGTQKMVRSEALSPEWLEREVNTTGGGKQQYYVYVLEANLVFHNGMVIPLMTEFLDYAQGDTQRSKQDCEQKAFHRLAKRLKKAFPRLSILALLDGLYANGPVMDRCREYNWQHMIVLQDGSLPSVWEEFNGLSCLEENNQLAQPWGDRRQSFRWINQIEYCWGPNQPKRLNVHVVVCREAWKEVDNHTGEIVRKHSKHAWLSSKPLHAKSIHERCNLGARHRWGIETGILVEKRHGYQYEHVFSHNWDAMRGYHYLMRLGHALNVLAQYSSALIKRVRQMGVRGLIDFLRETMTAPWFDPEQVQRRMAAPCQLRLE